MTNRYALASNCKVLIGEDKHRYFHVTAVLILLNRRRYFKRIIYNTDHRDVERVLQAKENIQPTIRLILLQAFNETRPGITAAMIKLCKQCPTLFDSLLPMSEREDMINKSFLSIIGDEEHRFPIVIGCLQVKYCRKVLQLPTINLTSCRLSERRFQMVRGDFVNYRNGLIGRINHIFVHELLQDQSRVFL